MKVIVNRRNAADHPFTLPREKELDGGVLVERVLFRVDQLVDITPEWRNPVGIVTIEYERKLDEILLIAPGPYRIDAHR